MSIEIAAPTLSLLIHGEPTDIDLDIFQGLWTEEQYLALTNQTNRLIEFSDGDIEVLPMPTREHQKMLAALYRKLFSYIHLLGGIVLFAPLRIQIRPGSFREPDLILLLGEHDPRNQDAFWLGADLVIEIVSPDRPQRDTHEKPRDYAEAGIPEYWIVNPLDATVTVLTLDHDQYVTHGIFRRGETATSLLLSGFSVEVDQVFDAA